MIMLFSVRFQALLWEPWLALAASMGLHCSEPIGLGGDTHRLQRALLCHLSESRDHFHNSAGESPSHLISSLRLLEKWQWLGTVVWI